MAGRQGRQVSEWVRQGDIYIKVGFFVQRWFDTRKVKPMYPPPAPPPPQPFLTLSLIDASQKLLAFFMQVNKAFGYFCRRFAPVNGTSESCGRVRCQTVQGLGDCTFGPIIATEGPSHLLPILHCSFDFNLLVFPVRETLSDGYIPL